MSLCKDHWDALAMALEQNGCSTGPYSFAAALASDQHPLADAHYLIAQNAFCAVGQAALDAECQVCRYGSKVWIERAAAITADKWHNTASAQ